MIIACFIAMRYHEKHGHLGIFTPVFSCFGLKKKNRKISFSPASSDIEGSAGCVVDMEQKEAGRQTVAAVDA